MAVMRAGNRLSAMQLLLAAVALVLVAVKGLLYSSILLRDGVHPVLAEMRTDELGILITLGLAILALLLLCWPPSTRVSKGTPSQLRGQHLRIKT
jgi:hypothetical protein